MLSPEELASWHEDGMLILRGFYGNAELDAVDETMRRIWAERDDRVVVDDLQTRRRCLLSALSEEERGHRFKTNDLYLTEQSLREIGLGARMATVLSALLEDTPILCNSLNFDQGSAQGAHIDSLYMTPLTRGHLCATWVALEDVSPDAGPLFFYRGSHKLPPHTFSDGTYHSIESEMPAWHAKMDQLVIEHGLKYETFVAKRGDVFIWSSDLLHGGSPIADVARTRKSVVFHYFTKTDCDKMGWVLKPMSGAWWIDKPRLAVPEDVTVSPPAPARSPKMARARELERLQKRVELLERQLARLRSDPLGVRLAGARVRKWFRKRVGDHLRQR